MGCTYLLDQCLHSRDVSSPIGSDDGASDSGYASSIASKLGSTSYDLYIPAPPELLRQQAYWYHLTTRNYFAYAASKPVVGEKLGPALIDLWDRLKEWSPKDATLPRFLAYCEQQGYLDLAENVDHAVACLVLAEQTRARRLWTDAFVHCVGMVDRLEASQEYGPLSNTTKALIARASLEMDLHIERVASALGSFLEDELSAEHLGLSKPARDHLDRFRSALHGYYVDKLGYFPPNEESPWNKRLWTKMYHSFQTLYEYLVDNESETDLPSLRGINGGICVAQNIQAFDQRHGYTPLPHALPLLPEDFKKRPADTPKGLRSFKLNRGESTLDAKTVARQALEQATNSQDPDVMSCQLVQEYQRIERQRLEDKLSNAEARKVRWLLIYSVLQMLISITRAPKEVRDTETPSYPLCVLTTGGPAWLEDDAVDEDAEAAVRLSLSAEVERELLHDDDASERLSIHPDCEADNAQDFFASNGISRRTSQMSLDMTPPPLRITTQLSTSASIRSSVHSSVHALHRSMVGSLARRGSLRRAVSTPQTPTKGSSHCEILIEGYGNGSAKHEEGSRNGSPLALVKTANRESNPLAEFNFGLDNGHEEPLMDHFQLDENNTLRSVSDGCLSSMFTDHTGSTRSSTYLDAYDSPITDGSTWGDEASRRNSDSSVSCSPIKASDKISPVTPSKQHRYKQPQLNFGVRSNCFSVNAGCYTPSGYQPTAEAIELPVSKFSDKRVYSTESMASMASSVYPDDASSQQAAEIEEEELRGRRRSRLLDMLSRSDLAAQGRRLFS